MSSTMSADALRREGGTPVRWVECPRDAWQSLPVHIPSERKVDYLRSLLHAGLVHLDLGSFVSARAVPQMADTEEVLGSLERPPGADFLCIIANRRGLERASASAVATSVGYPLSLNETFALRNTGRGLRESWSLVEELRQGSRECGLDLVVYVSMGFGNPYGEPWAPADTAEAVARLRDLGIERIALADTVGTADAQLVAEVLAATEAPSRLGVHLHARPERWQGVVEAAWQAGVRWFEGALSGAGGCPFAGDDLVGNLPSERVLPWLAERGDLGDVRLEMLPELAERAARMGAWGSGRG